MQQNFVSHETVMLMRARANVTKSDAETETLQKLTRSLAALLREIAKDNADFAELYLDDPEARIRLQRIGLPASALEVIALDMDLRRESVYDLLGVSRATATRLVKGRKSLSTSATERAVFLAGLVKTIEEQVPEDANTGDFDASKWVARWLDTAQPALGGKTPGSYLDTADGRTLVHRLLLQMIGGAYA